MVFPTSPGVCFSACLFLCFLCPYFLDGTHFGPRFHAFLDFRLLWLDKALGEVLWNCDWPLFPVCDLGFFSNAPVVGKLGNGEICVHLCTRFTFSSPVPYHAFGISRQRPFPDDAFSCFRRTVDGKLCYVSPLPTATSFSDGLTFFRQFSFFSSGPSVHTLVQREGGECFIISSWADTVVFISCNRMGLYVCLPSRLDGGIFARI